MRILWIWIWRVSLITALLATVAEARVLAQAYQWQSLTASGATQVVQNFEGNPNLSVTVTSSPPQNNGGPTGAGYEYGMTAGVFSYHVCEYSATEFQRENTQFDLDPDSFYGTTFDPLNPAGPLLTQAQCQTIATNFMQAHYPDTTVLPLTAAVGQDMTDGNGWIRDYSFTYVAQPASGCVAACYCRVSVDTIQGQVIGYSQCYFPVNVSLTPSLTSDQAAADAAQEMQLNGATVTQVNGLTVTKPDALGWDHLAYWLYMTGQGPSDGGLEPYLVVVDANNGQVIDEGIVMGGHVGSSGRRKSLPRAKKSAFLSVSWGGKKTALTHPPVLLHGKPYFWAGYTGKATRLKGVRRVGRDKYLPLAVASRLMSRSLSYRSRDRTVVIE